MTTAELLGGASPRRVHRLAALVLAALALSACGGSGGGTPGDDGPVSPVDPTPAPDPDPDPDPTPDPDPDAIGPFAVGCDWAPVFEIGDDDFSLIDTSADYWVAVGPDDPAEGDRLRLEGRYADARYTSLHLYNGLTLAADALADNETRPDSGSNPFTNNTERAQDSAVGNAYTAFVEFAQPRFDIFRQPNTLYRRNPDDVAPALRRTFMLYRVYRPAPGLAGDGGVGLPRLVLETADGERPLAGSPDGAECDELMDYIRLVFTDVIEPPNRGERIPPPITDPPVMEKFVGFGEELGGAPYVNLHINYLLTTLDRTVDPIVLMRARAPTFTDQPGIQSPADVRFWSICNNAFGSNFVAGCVSDFQAVIDSDGFYNVVVSSPQARPAGAVVEQGFNWIPDAATDPALLVYRHMLPNPDFDEAVQNVDDGQPPAEVMGDFTPQLTYCTPAVFDANAGQPPAAVFAACAAARP